MALESRRTVQQRMKTCAGKQDAWHLEANTAFAMGHDDHSQIVSFLQVNGDTFQLLVLGDLQLLRRDHPR